MLKRRMIIFVGRGRIGKAQPDESLILTPLGFRALGSLSVGDLVTCPDGRTAPITGVFPQGEKDIFRIEFYDGRTAECCAEHLWKVWVPGDQREVGKSHQTRRNIGWGRWQVVDTAWLKRRLEQWDRSARVRRTKRSLGIPMVEPFAMEMPPQTLPIPPYVLGALLGDGGITVQVNLTCADSEIIELVASQLSNYDVVSNGSRYGYRLRMKQEYAADLRLGPLFRPDWTSNIRSPMVLSLQKLGLHGTRSHEKFIPHIYKMGSVSQRLAILQGLMDTDGSPARASANLTTTSYQLAKDIREIAWSLGGFCTIKERQTYYAHKGEKKAGKPSWRVSIVHPQAAKFFALSRKVALCSGENSQTRLRIKSIAPAGRKSARCIMIDHPDHLYVTNDYVVTHNSTLANAVFEEMQHRKHPVTAWDLDRAPMLSRYVDARRPSDASDRSRRVALEDAIHETIGGNGHAIVDLGGDDPMVNQVQDKLPDMTAMFADAGLETVACHVVGPQLKDLAYFRAVQDSDTFARQVVALNHGMAPDGVDPDAAFALVRKSVGDAYPKLAVRQLPPEAIDAMLARERGQTLTDLAENSASGLKFVNRMVLMSWLNLSIAPLVDVLMEDPPPLPEAA